MFKKWLPWKFIMKRAARTYGFLDPVTLLGRLRQFGQPSEVQEPIELIRAGVVFHARGLVNTRAIQYNLDWIWPYWIVKQFKPQDCSFIPRGFAFSHVNLTHRNWTAVGTPDMPYYPIVDPRGLVTPYLDGWSIDFWMLSTDGDMLVPSESDTTDQRLHMTEASLSVQTKTEKPGLRLDTTVWVDRNQGEYQTRIEVNGSSQKGGWLVLSLRPYNPEGIQFIDTIDYDRKRRRLRVNHDAEVRFDRTPEKVLFSNYEHGDIAHGLDQAEKERSVSCDIGMATAAGLFPVDPDQVSTLSVSLPLVDSAPDQPAGRVTRQNPTESDWAALLPHTARLDVPDEKIQYLYDAAIRTMLLLSVHEPYPGPYTYKRFWFRDACLMVNGLLAVGMSKRAARMILPFPERQTMTGYFQSQEGEWDSNGQVLWIAGRLHDLTGMDYDDYFMDSIYKGSDWIVNKRITEAPGMLHQGLFPAGFSAEHLGPNDYYYWDNFWGVAGLFAAAGLAGRLGLTDRQKLLNRRAEAFQSRILHSIEQIPERRKKGGIPASPYRRMDAGAIGSLVADYPLQLTRPNDPRIMNTAAYLMKNCFHSGGFFQDMIHSGINIYLTLALAQTLLRAGDPGYRRLIRTVADLSSPTGQWPEAIHPFTKGGCMGDGQHGWAAAEWLMMIRNLFVREEGDRIVIGSGLFPEWIGSGRALSFGPTSIPGGRLTVTIQKSNQDVRLNVDLQSRKPGLKVMADIPGYERKEVTPSPNPIMISPVSQEHH